LRKVGIVVEREAGPQRRPEGEFLEEMLECAGVTQLLAPLADSQAANRSLGCDVSHCSSSFICDRSHPALPRPTTRWAGSSCALGRAEAEPEVVPRVVEVLAAWLRRTRRLPVPVNVRA